ncbi:MAG: hypothetical protein WA954_00790 [Parerythrobacter sp.]
MGGLACVVMGLVSGAQAISAVMAKPNPALASRLSLYAADGNERLASQLFSAGATGLSARVAARALATDPLNGENVAFVARSFDNRRRKAELLQAGERISRRGYVLQGTLLEHYIGVEDVAGVVKTLDRIITVNPELTGKIMPVMVDTLDQPGAVDLYANLLNDDPGWKDAFLEASLTRPEFLDQLLALRRKLSRGVTTTSAFDKRFVALLLAEGRYSEARQFYLMATGDRLAQSVNETATLNWVEDIPPFDWKFENQPNEYARYRSQDDSLALRFGSGRGGDVARRVVITKRPVAQFVFEHTFEPRARKGEGVFASVTCDGNPNEIARVRLERSPTTLSLDQADTCSRYILVLSGRSWSGSEAIDGLIDTIKIQYKR